MTREMTKEEAKLILEEIHDAMYDGYMNILAGGGKPDTTLENDIEAYEVAIEALSEPPRPKGWWEGRHVIRFSGKDEAGDPIYRHYYSYLCSECGTGTVVKQNYCGHCGADMRGKEE